MTRKKVLFHSSQRLFILAKIWYIWDFKESKVCCNSMTAPYIIFQDLSSIPCKIYRIELSPTQFRIHINRGKPNQNTRQISWISLTWIYGAHSLLFSFCCSLFYYSSMSSGFSILSKRMLVTKFSLITGLFLILAE